MKNIVKYNNLAYSNIHVGHSALVYPIDHPGHGGLVTNTTLVSTSLVIAHDLATGEFETQNSKYVPISLTKA